MSLCERGECLRLAKSHSFRYFEDSVGSTNCTVTESLRLRWASVLFFKGQTSMIVARTTLPTMRTLPKASCLMLKQWMHSWTDLMLVLIDEARCVNCSAFHYLFFMGQCHTRVWLWILCKCSAILISPEDAPTSSASAEEPVVQPEEQPEGPVVQPDEPVVQPEEPVKPVVPAKRMPGSKASKQQLGVPWVPLPPLPPGPPPVKKSEATGSGGSGSAGPEEPVSEGPAAQPLQPLPLKPHPVLKSTTKTSPFVKQQVQDSAVKKATADILKQIQAQIAGDGQGSGSGSGASGADIGTGAAATIRATTAASASGLASAPAASAAIASVPASAPAASAAIASGPASARPAAGPKPLSRATSVSSLPDINPWAGFTGAREARNRAAWEEDWEVEGKGGKGKYGSGSSGSGWPYGWGSRDHWKGESWKGSGKGKWGKQGPVWIDRGHNSGYKIKVQDLPRGPPALSSAFLRQRIADDLEPRDRWVLRYITDVHVTYTAESGSGGVLCSKIKC